MTALLTASARPLYADAPLNIRTIDIDDSGRRRTFEVAEDELFLRSENGAERVMRTPRGSRDLNLPTQPFELQQGTRGEVELVLYEKNIPKSDSTRRILTKQVLVRLSPETEISTIARKAGAASVRSIPYAPGWFILEAKETGEALKMAVTLRRTLGVRSADPLLGRKWSKKTIPNDTLFTSQWFLLNTGQSGGKPGIDLNVTNVWDRYRGRGVTIAIVDDGLQLTHPDLAQNTKTNLHYDYRDGDGDPSPSGSDDFHGTAVAGIAAARGNNSQGVAGVAYEATLAGIRLVGGNVQTDEQSAAAIVHSNQVVQVSNNSWGAEDDGKTLDGPGPLLQRALENSTLHGRGGKGTIFVWAAGNGGEVQDNVNYDGYANSMHVIAVTALNDQGKQAAYSEPGACVAVAAPSNIGEGSTLEGIATTDLIGEEGLNYSTAPGDLADKNYTQFFGGTSAAAAMVTGVVALVLEANSNLGWRDAKEILIRSATQVDPGDPDWVTNGAGLHFNHKYGAGLVNAAAAIRLATNWINLGTQTNLVLEQNNLSDPIPDNDPSGRTLVFDFRKTPALRVEHAVVTATITHPRRGDLAITLVSPQGTRSRLAEKHSDPNSDYNSWTFTSVFNWGEISQGEWKLNIVDLRANATGTVKAVRLALFGTDFPERTRPWLEVSGFEGERFKIRLTAQPGYRYELQASTNLVDWAAVLSTNLVSGNTIDFREEPAAGFRRRFYRAVREGLEPQR